MAVLAEPLTALLRQRDVSLARSLQLRDLLSRVRFGEERLNGRATVLKSVGRLN